jgi:hypothetical protein
VLTSGGKVLALHNGDGRLLWSLDFGPAAAPRKLALWRLPHDMQHDTEASGAGAVTVDKEQGCGLQVGMLLAGLPAHPAAAWPSFKSAWQSVCATSVLLIPAASCHGPHPSPPSCRLWPSLWAATAPLPPSSTPAPAQCSRP